MVVISRKKNESLVIGDNIIVTVIEIRGDKVRLGIEHPKEMPVHRKEIYEAILREASPPPIPSARPPEPPKSQLPEQQPDQLDRLAAALHDRLGVRVERELLRQAVREAGIEVH
jgi:carbon storage regulator